LESLSGRGSRSFLSIMCFRALFSSIVIMAFLFQGWALAGEGRWEEPWGKETFSRAAPAPEQEKALSLGQRAASGLIGIFRTYISPVDGDRCPSYPSCSQYGLEAIRKHGVLVGLVMTFDRLIHESDEIRIAPPVKVSDSYRYYDPVENNDFWWDKK
jgi:hypothetical protein